MDSDYERYVEACKFPGPLDERAVEQHLAAYLEAFGVKRKIARLRPGWTFEEYPALEQFAKEVLKEIQPTLADIDAIAPRDEPSVRAALYNGVARASTAARRTGSILIGGYCTGELNEEELDAELEQGCARVVRETLGSVAHLVTEHELAALASLALRAHRNPLGLPEVRNPMAAREMIANGHIIDAFGTLSVQLVQDVVARSGYRKAVQARDASDAEVAHAARQALFGRQPLAARDASNALPPRKGTVDGDALRRFAAWCIQALERRPGFDLSWVATQWLGRSSRTSKAWSRAIFEAYIAGAWFLHCSGDTIFWVAKPRLHLDGTRRLHRAHGPAFESDVENLYFWHGVLVPAFIVTRPQEITLDHIRAEENAEVRRVMVERYGSSRYLLDSNAEVIHQDELGMLYRAPHVGDEALVMVRVVNSTPEPDGSCKEYFLRVPPTMKRAREAVAWTFGLHETEYNPEVQT